MADATTAAARATYQLERRRRLGKCLACLTGAAAFFALYVLSWVAVLDMY